MTNQLGCSPKIYHQSSKPIFLRQKKSTHFLCGLCQIFNKEQSDLCHKQVKLIKNVGSNHFLKNDTNLTKSGKKSLKRNQKIKDFYQIKANFVQPKKQIRNSQKIQKSTNINSQTILQLSQFRKTQFSDKGINSSSVQKYISESQINKNMTYYSSCVNLKNQPHNKYSRDLHAQKNGNLVGIQMIRSLSNQNISITKSLNLPKSEVKKQPMIENKKIQKIKFQPGVTQNFFSLRISPVGPLPVLEQSERQGMISSTRKGQDETTINKLLELRSTNLLDQQNVSSRTLKINQDLNIKDDLEQNMMNIISSARVIPSIPIYQKDFSLKSNQNQDFLEMSFHQIDQQWSQNDKKMIISMEKKQQSLGNRQISTNFNEIKITSKYQKGLSSDIGSHSNEPQHTEIAEKHQITIQMAGKNNNSPFGRYSVEIPKSKNFNHMKVRRTISMKDQQGSSQDETSEVIYGFRNINKLAVMQDINEQMQQSYMTKIESKFTSPEKQKIRLF